VTTTFRTSPGASDTLAGETSHEEPAGRSDVVENVTTRARVASLRTITVTAVVHTGAAVGARPKLRLGGSTVTPAVAAAYASIRPAPCWKGSTPTSRAEFMSTDLRMAGVQPGWS
jgi:hypothetical protein